MKLLIYILTEFIKLIFWPDYSKGKFHEEN